MNTDLIIIGSGPGGYRAAEYAAKNGLQVVIVESAQAGGTCLNCGCIPTKAFCHDAELAALGIHADFPEIVERKQAIVNQLRSGVETLMQMPGITFVHGHAHFSSATSADGQTVVEVVSTTTEHETVVQQFTAPNVIIATGSRTKMLPIPGITGPCCVTSTELLDIQQVPDKLCIIGAGVIGMEFASIFSGFGSEVTVVEFLKECLPAMDSDIAKRLRKQLEKRGVKFFMQAGVKKVEDRVVTFERKGKEESVEADVILVATGRTPNIENLNLDAVGVLYDRTGIKVDPETYRVEWADSASTKPSGTNIFAIGDVNGRQMLAHAATMQGIRAVNTILGRADGIRLDIMPAAVFTTPEAACVGPTEDQLKADGCEYVCHKGYYRANGKALTMEATDGLVKLFTDPDDRIIGCHILGAHAADLVQEVSALMNRDTTLAQLREIVHIHPTLGEILQDL